MKKILFLTNFKNSDPEEDRYLISILRNHFEIIPIHPLECEQYLSVADGIIIRNIWPTYEYAEEWERFAGIIRDLKIPTYNPLTGKGDNRGKGYLVDLYRKGFPVIPSVDKVEDVNKLPESEFYYIKPKDSCDGFGDQKLAGPELLEKDLKDFIIQPYEEFTSEPSFFFIDNVFSYAIVMPNRLDEKGIEQYEPTPADLDFAHKFVEWESLPYGIQRVDAVRTKKGELLLTEDEDIAEYLYLFDLEERERERVIYEIVFSVKKAFKIA